MELINLNGARGVGKSTLTEKLKSGPTTYTVEVIHSSKVLSEMSHTVYNLEINQLNYSQLFEIQQNLIDNAKRLDKDVVIFDTHNVELVYGIGKIKSLTPEAHIYEFGAYITIEVDPKTLLERRKNQETIKRSLNLSDIMLEISAERNESIKLANISNKKFYRINNKELDSAVKDLDEIIKKELSINKNYGNRFYNNK